MNRRSFLKSAAVAGVAASITIPGARIIADVDDVHVLFGNSLDYSAEHIDREQLSLLETRLKDSVYEGIRSSGHIPIPGSETIRHLGPAIEQPIPCNSIAVTVKARKAGAVVRWLRGATKRTLVGK